MVKILEKEKSIKQIIQLFQKSKPKSLIEVQNLGLNPRFFAKGCDRRVYRIGKKLVMKLEDADSSSFDQSPREILTIRRIFKFKKYASIRKHVAPILYADIKNRVIIMPFYPKKVSDYDTNDNSDVAYIAERLQSFLPKHTDLHYANFRRDKNGKAVCVDLGYTIGESSRTVSN